MFHKLNKNATFENRNKQKKPRADGVQHLRDHVLEGLHDLGALCLLEVGEAASDDDDGWQHDAQIELRVEENI